MPTTHTPQNDAQESSLALLQERFPELAFGLKGGYAHTAIEKDALVDALQALKHSPDFYIDALECLTVTDQGPTVGTLQVHYHVQSITKGHKLWLTVEVERDGGLVPSVAALFPTADWHEREAYDLFGLHFGGHPDLRRLLLPADWEGHPLRKDYAQASEYHGLKIAYERPETPEDWQAAQ
jgi:NADH-quinone oxidoreductase subunit C